MLDEIRIAHKFCQKLERALDKINIKGLPISDAIRRAHTAMLNKAQQLFTVPMFNLEQPDNVDK